MHQSFLAYNKFKYLKISFFLVLTAVVLYLWDSPSPVPNGGTWLGYGLGTIGALLIVWLMWLGIRKRQYASSLGTVRGWLSAHIYLGVSLLVIATLHTGFQLGWNIHTLAYGLMVIVIVSGLYGVYVYIRYPRLVNNPRQSRTRKEMLLQLEELDQKLLANAKRLSDTAHKQMLKVVQETVLGGGVRRQLYEANHKEIERELDALRKDLMEQNVSGKEDNVKYVVELLNIVSRRSSLIDKINLDIRYHSILSLWLYFHVPLSFALLAALITHIVTVFFYW